MERLTMKKRFENYRPDEETTTVCVDGHMMHTVESIERIDDYLVVDHTERYLTGEVVDKLAYYEDLEEQGLLLKLHFGIGDVVYEVVDGADGNYCVIARKCRTYALLCTLNEKVGKTVFLTKEEAEEALRKKVDK